MGWKKSSKELPEYGEMVVFALTTGTHYLGWLESEKDIEDNEDMWFADCPGGWFPLEKVAGWLQYPECPFKKVVEAEQF